MYIEKIHSNNWVDHEADVYVTGGGQQIICYAHSARRVQVGDAVRALRVDGCTGLRKTAEPCGFEKLPPFYGYRVRGEIVSAKARTVRVDEFMLRLKHKLPRALRDGDRVCFYAQRLTCILASDAPGARAASREIGGVPAT